MKKLVKRKHAGSNGNVQLQPFELTDVKETVITENFYQPIPVSILKYYMPNGMM